MMKKTFIVSMFLLIPVLGWSQPKVGPNKLVVVFALVNGQPCQTVVPGSGPQWVGSRALLAGTPLIVAVLATDPNYGPVATTRDIRIGVKEAEVLPFLSGGLSETTAWHSRTLISLPLPFPPGYCGVADTIIPRRATTHQWGANAFDLTEYVFVAQDAGLGPDTLIEGESLPLDSVIPNINTYNQLLLVLAFDDGFPAEQHFPGDKFGRGKRGIPEPGINEGPFYSFWVYGVDDYFNAMPFDPGTPENVHLQFCETSLHPHTVKDEADVPPPTLLRTDVVRPTDGGIDQVSKVKLQVMYASTGYAGLQASNQSGGLVSHCEHFSVLGEGPTPDDNIRIHPNPGGTPVDGQSVHITIGAVRLGGGKVYAKIYDCFGYVIRDFSEELQAIFYADTEAPYWHLDWDYRNEKGHTVASGCYHLCVEVVQVEKAGVWKAKIGVVW
jgi:hypothetical protein